MPPRPRPRRAARAPSPRATVPERANPDTGTVLLGIGVLAAVAVASDSLPEVIEWSDESRWCGSAMH